MALAVEVPTPENTTVATLLLHPKDVTELPEVVKSLAAVIVTVLVPIVPTVILPAPTAKESATEPEVTVTFKAGEVRETVVVALKITAAA